MNIQINQHAIAITDTTFDDNTDTMDGFFDNNSLIEIVEDGSSCTQLPSVWANVTDNDVITEHNSLHKMLIFQQLNNYSEANIYTYCTIIYMADIIILM